MELQSGGTQTPINLSSIEQALGQPNNIPQNIDLFDDPIPSNNITQSLKQIYRELFNIRTNPTTVMRRQPSVSINSSISFSSTATEALSNNIQVPTGSEFVSIIIKQFAADVANLNCQIVWRPETPTWVDSARELLGNIPMSFSPASAIYFIPIKSMLLSLVATHTSPVASGTVIRFTVRFF